MKTVLSTSITIVLLAFCGFAQTGTLFKKAPAGVEESLRARVKQFFTLQVDGKFRASEGFVCDDTKDYYYNLSKKPPREFEIDKVTFDDSFAGADVLVLVGGEIMTISGVIPLKALMATRWRLENNQWCYYVSQQDQKTVKTPFGEVNVEEMERNRKAGAPTPVIKPVTVDDVQQSVVSSAQRVIFVATKPGAAVVEFTNSLPGVATISTEGTLPPGIKVTITPSEVNTKESAKVKFEYTPGKTFPEKEYLVSFAVEPTRQIVKISVVFELPEEIKKTLPKIEFPKQ